MTAPTPSPVTDEMVERAARNLWPSFDIQPASEQAVLLSEARSALTAALAVDGLALVPKEPTSAMKVAGGMKVEDIIFGGEGNHETIFDAMKDVWTAMLTAASDSDGRWGRWTQS